MTTDGEEEDDGRYEHMVDNLIQLHLVSCGVTRMNITLHRHIVAR